MSPSPLGEAARRGAQLILQKALEAEVDDFLGRGRYERSDDGGLRGHRNVRSLSLRVVLRAGAGQ